MNGKIELHRNLHTAVCDVIKVYIQRSQTQTNNRFKLVSILLSNAIKGKSTYKYELNEFSRSLVSSLIRNLEEANIIRHTHKEVFLDPDLLNYRRITKSNMDNLEVSYTHLNRPFDVNKNIEEYLTDELMDYVVAPAFEMSEILPPTESPMTKEDEYNMRRLMKLAKSDL